MGHTKDRIWRRDPSKSNLFHVATQRSFRAAKWWWPGDLWNTWPHYNAINLRRHPEKGGCERECLHRATTPFSACSQQCIALRTRQISVTLHKKWNIQHQLVYTSWNLIIQSWNMRNLTKRARLTYSNRFMMSNQ